MSEDRLWQEGIDEVLWEVAEVLLEVVAHLGIAVKRSHLSLVRLIHTVSGPRYYVESVSHVKNGICKFRTS